MVADRQTHALPASEAALAAFTIFLGDPHFIRDFPKLLARVHGHFLAFFDAGDDPAQIQWIDPGAGRPPPAAFVTQLTLLGFTDIRHIAERLRAWKNGHMPALRSERARGLLDSLLPSLLTVLGQQPDPDKAFAHFDALLSRQRAGVQLLSLFQRNPALLRRLAAVLGAAPALAEHLEQDAYALEALLVAQRALCRPQTAVAPDAAGCAAIWKKPVATTPALRPARGIPSLGRNARGADRYRCGRAAAQRSRGGLALGAAAARAGPAPWPATAASAAAPSRWSPSARPAAARCWRARTST